MSAGFCGTCGTKRFSPDQRYCTNCGRPFAGANSSVHPLQLVDEVRTDPSGAVSLESAAGSITGKAILAGSFALIALVLTWLLLRHTPLGRPTTQSISLADTCSNSAVYRMGPVPGSGLVMDWPATEVTVDLANSSRTVLHIDRVTIRLYGLNGTEIECSPWSGSAFTRRILKPGQAVRLRALCALELPPPGWPTIQKPPSAATAEIHIQSGENGIASGQTTCSGEPVTVDVGQ
jgi:hypothetical protein